MRNDRETLPRTISKSSLADLTGTHALGDCIREVMNLARILSGLSCTLSLHPVSAPFLVVTAPVLHTIFTSTG
jgi:hypothetical protein